MTGQPNHDEYDLRLCGNCGTELGRFENGQICFDCPGARVVTGRRKGTTTP
jgi:hypothetical protein